MLKSVSEFVSKVAGRIEKISLEQALKIENFLVLYALRIWGSCGSSR